MDGTVNCTFDSLAKTGCRAYIVFEGVSYTSFVFLSEVWHYWHVFRGKESALVDVTSKFHCVIQ